MFTVVWWGAGRLEEDAGGGGSGVGLQRSEVRGFMRRAAGSDRRGAPQQQLGCLSFALVCV